MSNSLSLLNVWYCTEQQVIDASTHPFSKCRTLLRAYVHRTKEGRHFKHTL